MDIPATQSAALYLLQHGISVIPMYPNRDKRPAVKWKQYMEERATEEQIIEWFSGGAPVGVVTGTASGNLVMAEIEGRARNQFGELAELAAASGMQELWDRVNQGWVEISPSGGIHWFFRTQSTPEGNRKLAQRPATPEELEANPQEKRKVLAETRGQGGYVVVAPTPGWFHETGNPWVLARGTSPANVPVLDDSEADAFLSLLGSLDVPIPGEPSAGDEAPKQAKTPGVNQWGGMSPGDDFEQRTPWEDILIPAGWTKLFESGGVKYWTRPGKRTGISASTGKDPARDRLYVFTSSTDFLPQVPYTKFGAYAHLEHGNDFRAAASALRGKGFGRDPEIQSTPTPPRMEAVPADPDTRQDREPARINPDRGQTIGPVTSGALAEVTNIETKRRPAGAGPVALLRTEHGNAALFINEHRSSVRYNTVSKQWVIWENTRWVPDSESRSGNAQYRAQQVVSNLPSDSEEARKWKQKSSTASMLSNMLKIASADPAIAVRSTDFDARAWELNTPAGAVNLRTGELMAPDPEAMHMKSTAVVPDFDADVTPWTKFLEETFPGQEGMVEFVQVLAGYTLIGEVREHVIIFGHGKGGNGKGITVEIMSTLLGDYAISTATDFLMKKPFNDHPQEIAKLYGARMVVNSEIDPKAKFDEARAQNLSGGDRLSGRFMGQNEFTFSPTHQLWLTGNYLPNVPGGSESFWRRMNLLPFTHDVPKEEQDVGLKWRLLDRHGPAILAWMIRGAVKYAERGLLAYQPAAVEQATNEYKKNTNTLARFLEEECWVTEPEDRGSAAMGIPVVTVRQFNNQYQAWCRDNGEDWMTPQRVSRALKDDYSIVTNPRNRTTTGRMQYEWVELRDKSRRYGPDAPGEPEE